MVRMERERAKVEVDESGSGDRWTRWDRDWGVGEWGSDLVQVAAISISITISIGSGARSG